MSDKKVKKLFGAITNISDDIIEEAQTASIQKKPHVLKKWCALAACICIVITGSIMLFDKDKNPGPDNTDDMQETEKGDTIKEGVDAYTGKIFDGAYYYSSYSSESGHSFWRYKIGGEPELLFTDRINADFVLTEHGVYYTQNLNFYFRSYNGEEPVLLYSTSDPETDQVRFKVLDNGTVILRIMDLRDMSGNLKYGQRATSVLIDGKTGEVLETLYESIPFAESISLDFKIQWQSFSVGERVFQCVPDEEYSEYYDVLENGVSILPEGSLASIPMRKFGDGIMIEVYDSPTTSGAFWQLYVLPDGRNVDLGMRAYHSAIGDGGRYLLYHYHRGIYGVYDISTGEKWPLGSDAKLTYNDTETDGKYIFTTAYGSADHALWEIVYDDTGKPIEVLLLDEDIRN